MISPFVKEDVDDGLLGIRATSSLDLILLLVVAIWVESVQEHLLFIISVRFIIIDWVLIRYET